MNDIQVLERAIHVAENMEPTIGYDVLLAAAKRYVRSQRVYPAGGGSSSNNRCPSCGQYNAGAHFCVGRSGGMGGVYNHQLLTTVTGAATNGETATQA